MTDWAPALVMPNIRMQAAIEGDFIVLAPPDDERVGSYCQRHPNFESFINRFTDNFGVRLRPCVLMTRTDMYDKFGRRIAPLASFRDLVALSVVAYSRALLQIYEKPGHIIYSDLFTLYRNRGKTPGGQACALRSLTRSGRNGTSAVAALSLAPR